MTLVYSEAVGSFTLAFPLFVGLFAVGFVLWAFWLGGALRSTTPPEGPRTGAGTAETPGRATSALTPNSPSTSSPVYAAVADE